jgi:hypothetical protein
MQTVPNWVRYAIGIGAVLIVLIVLAIQYTAGGSAVAIPSVTPTATHTPTAARLPATSTPLPPTATPNPPTGTPPAPVATQVLPTATPVVIVVVVTATATPIPPAATSVLPIPALPTGTPRATPVSDICRASANALTHCVFAGFGVTIDVPVQTARRTLDLTASIPGAVPPAKEDIGIRVIRPVVELLAVSGKDVVTQFDPPLTVSIQYNEVDLLKVGDNVTRLKVFLYDGQRWTDFPNPQRDSTARTLTISLPSLLGSHDPLGIAY